MSDQTILITGGTGNVGARYVEFFLRKGWKVLFTTRSSLKKKKLENKFIDYRKKLKGYKIDLLKKNALKSLLTKIKKDKFYINHLVNSARSIDFLKVDKKTGMTSRENFLNEYLLNVFIPYELSFEIFNSNKKTLKTITNIGSQYGIVGSNPKLYKNKYADYPIHYGVAKSGLIHLTKELAIRFSRSKVRVNCLALGGIEGRATNKFKKRYANLTPMRRMLKLNDIVKPLEMIIDSDSKAINGQTIVADGGWTLW
ncbi:SDR family oxidoreductase [Candidatus Pelagibacter ubique]|nr:SDR family oxidoreductase [Candidatus Pelagibacter ubique]